MGPLDLITEEVKEVQERLSCCLYIMATSSNIWQRIYYENLVYQDTFRLERMLEEVKQIVQENVNNDDNTLPIFTLEELAYFDGSGGKPAYVAINGFVYDVSLNAAWGGGSHFGLIAGKDLSAQFTGCHPSEEILRVLAKVGVVQ